MIGEGTRRENELDDSGRVRRIRYHMAVQKNRAIVYFFASLVGLFFVNIRLAETGITAIVTIFALAFLSAVLLYYYHRLRLTRKGLHWDLKPVWMVCDAVLITAGVHVTGDFQSAWFPWYLANISGAVFVAGQWWGAAVALLDTVLYAALFVWTGDVRGFDHTLWQALFRMASLYGASFFFLRGVTDIKRKRATIRRYRDNEARKVRELTRLTETLNERTQELAEANQRIVEADRMKSQFLANMSHELRTPLNSIIGFSEVLLDRLEGQLSDKFMRFLDHIHSSGRHLLTIINNILDLSKVEAGKMELHPEQVSIQDTLEGVRSVMMALARKRNVRIKIDVPGNLPFMEADPVKVKQILYNLISNAVKFSYENSEVEVTGKALGPEESPLETACMVISVRDNGVGIDPKEHAQVFEAFHQSDQTLSRPFEGTGLGLSLVKKFVHLHGGALTLESALGKGSTFSVLLPLAFLAGTGGEPEEKQRAEAGEPLPSGEERPVVLVVEDDPTAFASMDSILKAQGYGTVRARTGEEAVTLATTLKPAAITLDLILPGMDGWEVLGLLKEDPATRGVPVIIVSVQDNRELGLTLGADDFFLKPVVPERLISRIKELVPPVEEPSGRILLIDDEPSFHELMESWFEGLPYTMDHAFSGKTGIEDAVSKRPALILLDLMMEEMDGFEVARYLADHPSTAGIPICVITAKTLTAEDRERLGDKIAMLVQKAGQSRQALVKAVEDLLARTRKRKGAP